MPLLSTKGAASAQGFGMFGSIPSVYWIGTLGGTSGIQQSGYSVAVSSANNVYVCGYSIDSGIGNTIQFAKYNSSGVIQWQRRLSGGSAPGYGIAVDASENVYVCGATAASGTNNFQIAKYNTSGTIQWQRSLGGSVTDVPYSIAADSSGNSYICGYSNNTGDNDIQIAKYDTSGTLQWQKYLGTGGVSDIGYSVAVDSSSNVYICGDATFSGRDCIQVAKYNSSGTIQWQRQLRDASYSAQGRGVAVDSSGNVYVCGSTNIVFGIYQLIIAKYNSSGTLQWQRLLDVGGVGGYGVAVDSSGNSYAVGYSVGNFVIAKYNTSGTIQWQRTMGGSGADNCYGAAVDLSGNIYVCGNTDNNSYDFLFAKLPSDGSKTGTYSVGGYSVTYAASSFTDSASTLTSASSVLTDTTSSLTSSASSLTDASTSLISSVTII